ncbi:recombinase family protein [Massilia sp. YIM B02763]|uniref:recombinase family protein n=1 Tax=Massilia sp. YIM B02763 TaxID=3050130 RepID=UPI0035A66787
MLNTSQIVIEIIKLRAAGESFGRIAHWLNERGLRSEYGGRWYAASVRNVIIRN